MERLDSALRQSKARRTLPPPAVRRALRLQLGISQAAIAATVGVSRIAVLRWELGQRVPRGKILLRYVRVLDRLVREGAL